MALLSLLPRRRSAQADADSRPGPSWYGISRCPACGGPGYLVRLDPERRRSDQRCRGCRHTWTLTASGD